EILSPAEIARARRSGALVGEILAALRTRAVPGVNLLDIDRWAREMILGAGARSCYVDYEASFGTGPFGHWICTAVNDAVLHGKPHDRELVAGTCSRSTSPSPSRASRPMPPSASSSAAR